MNPRTTLKPIRDNDYYAHIRRASSRASELYEGGKIHYCLPVEFIDPIFKTIIDGPTFQKWLKRVERLELPEDIDAWLHPRICKRIKDQLSLAEAAINASVGFYPDMLPLTASVEVLPLPANSDTLSSSVEAALDKEIPNQSNRVRSSVTNSCSSGLSSYTPSLFPSLTNSADVAAAVQTLYVPRRSI